MKLTNRAAKGKRNPDLFGQKLRLRLRPGRPRISLEKLEDELASRRVVPKKRRRYRN